MQSAFKRRALYNKGKDTVLSDLQSQQDGRSCAAPGEKTALAKQNEAFATFGSSVLDKELANVAWV